MLASAERTDVSGADWSTVLLAVLTLAVFAALAAVPIALARRRGHGRGEAITVLAILCCLSFAGSIIWLLLARAHWAREQAVLVQSGYYDPLNAMGAPVVPWWLWAVLGSGYLCLVGFAGWGGRKRF